MGIVYREILLTTLWFSVSQTFFFWFLIFPFCLQELALKNPLHRKKLQLSLKNISSKQPEKSAELDYVWVTRM